MGSNFRSVSRHHKLVYGDDHVCTTGECGVNASISRRIPMAEWAGSTNRQKETLRLKVRRGDFDHYQDPDDLYDLIADAEAEEKANMPVTKSTGRARLDTFNLKNGYNPLGEDPETTGLRVSPDVIDYWLGGIEWRGVVFRSDRDGSLPSQVFNQMARTAPMDIEYMVKMLGCSIEPYGRSVFISIDPSEDRDMPWVAVVVLNGVEDAHDLHGMLVDRLRHRFYLLLAWYDKNREQIEAKRQAEFEATANSPEAVQERMRNLVSMTKADTLNDISDVLKEAGKLDLALDDPLLVQALESVVTSEDAPRVIERMLKAFERRTTEKKERIVAGAEEEREPGTYPHAEWVARMEEFDEEAEPGQKGEQS